MKKLLLIATVLLIAGCGSCRAHRSEDMRGMMAPSNLPEETVSPMQNVHFAFDSAVLSSESKATVKDNLKWIKDHGNPLVELGGHCDERGTNDYNMVLGMNRASSTLNYIASLGENPRNFTKVSYGEELPLDPAHNESAWAKNRSVQLRVK